MENPVIEFIGIYDADSTLRGEISYWIGARLGRSNCSLCEITHGVFTQKRQWTQCAAELPVPFVTYHRNDAPEDVRTAASGEFPIVLARTATTLRVVLSSTDLDQLHGSPDALSLRLSHIARGTP